MKLKNHYDIIIYGASISAIRFALKLISLKKSVLLINNYGFLGGAVTESYSCLQSVQNLEPDYFTQKLINDNFFSDGNNFVLNPEQIKIVLLQEIMNSDIDLLFHVLPRSLIFEDKFLKIILSAKEGEISVRGNYLIDGTEHGEILNLRYDLNNIVTDRVNLFLTKPQMQILEFRNSENLLVNLNDGRIWISLKTAQQKMEFYDFGEHELLINFEKIIKSSGSRIQLLPVRSEVEVLNRPHEIINNFLHLSWITGKNFQLNEELIRSQSITNYEIE